LTLSQVLTFSLIKATASIPNLWTSQTHRSYRMLGPGMSRVENQETGLQTRLRLVDRRQRHARGVFNIKVWGYKHRTPNSRPRTLKDTSNGYHSLQCAGSLRETQ
ncbi:hypothetical protein IQ06DRAFT_190914, partial [Phaeosphaeriaceae sp. SRC1lsM3a]